MLCKYMSTAGKDTRAANIYNDLIALDALALRVFCFWKLRGSVVDARAPRIYTNFDGNCQMCDRATSRVHWWRAA